MKKTNYNSDVLNKVSLFNTNNEAAEYIKKSVKTDSPYIVSFINAHAYNLSFENRMFHNALLKSDILLRDGVGMSILYKSIKSNPGANLNGSDFIPFLLDGFKKSKIALFGTVNPFLTTAKTNLEAKGFRVVLTESGFLPIPAYLALAQSSDADIIILGMGMPKQEQLSAFLKDNLSEKKIIINGGAIIDLWGCKVKRAPKFVRDFQLEWLYRLVIEPKRLFSRYVIGNYIFFKRILGIKKMIRKNPLQNKIEEPQSNGIPAQSAPTKKINSKKEQQDHFS